MKKATVKTVPILLICVLILFSCAKEPVSTESARLTDVAERGDVAAQYKLCQDYHHGTGVSKDDVASFRWCKSAAAQGLASAQYDLAVAYDLGEGVSPDRNEALKWYFKAAQQGDVDAQINLGHAYYYGKGVTRDAAQAGLWYWRAADQGSVEAQTQLGRMFDQGDGVPEDHDQALTWYDEAAYTADYDAQHMLKEPVGFACDDGQRFTITFNQRPDTAHLSFANNGSVETLKNSSPGSGVAYENTTYSYQEHGGTVTFASPKGETACHPLQPELQ